MFANLIKIKTPVYASIETPLTKPTQFPIFDGRIIILELLGFLSKKNLTKIKTPVAALIEIPLTKPKQIPIFDGKIIILLM